MLYNIQNRCILFYFGVLFFLSSPQSFTVGVGGNDDSILSLSLSLSLSLLENTSSIPFVQNKIELFLHRSFYYLFIYLCVCVCFPSSYTHTYYTQLSFEHDTRIHRYIGTFNEIIEPFLELYSIVCSLYIYPLYL